MDRFAFVAIAVIFLLSIKVVGQQTKSASKSAVKTVEVTAPVKETEVGQQLKLSVVAEDASGNIVNEQPSTYFAGPFDIAAADENGNVKIFGQGEVTAGAIVGGKGPQFVSQFRFNHHELYGDGWLAGTHSVYRYRNYLFIGDEVFPPFFDIQSPKRITARGICHGIDIADIYHPRKVAEYPVPEGGAHNIWVENDVMYMGYYAGGARIVDVSGELRGDLYRQGREFARIWTGDPNGFRPNLPFTWGAQPYNGLVYFNDINSGIWIVKLGEKIEKGSTTSPGH